MAAVEIARLDADQVRAAKADLARVLVDCVAGSASVSFMWPFGQAEGEAFFEGVAGEVAAHRTILLAARDGDGIVATVQLGLATPPNQPHRADVKKLLVHRAARRAGVAAALMAAIEAEARAAGRTLLVLDTVKGDAGERVYERAGWQKTGVIPDYALYPDGRLCDTVVFWKKV